MLDRTGAGLTVFFEDHGATTGLSDVLALQIGHSSSQENRVNTSSFSKARQARETSISSGQPILCTNSSDLSSPSNRKKPPSSSFLFHLFDSHLASMNVSLALAPFKADVSVAFICT